MTLEALIIANASLPTLSPSEAPDVLVMIDTICMPGAISRVTSQFTEPSTICKTRPFNILRALILISRNYQPKGSHGRNRESQKIRQKFPASADRIPSRPACESKFHQTLVASREKDSKARPDFLAAVVFCELPSCQQLKRMELSLNRRFDKNVH
jgi:hypothetical protein